MQSGKFGMREIAGGPDGERTVRVRFSGAHDGREQAARLGSLTQIRADLGHLGADGQTRHRQGEGWATWTFFPGAVEPDVLVHAVRRALLQRNPGSWDISCRVDE